MIHVGFSLTRSEGTQNWKKNPSSDHKTNKLILFWGRFLVAKTQCRDEKFRGERRICGDLRWRNGGIILAVRDEYFVVAARGLYPVHGQVEHATVLNATASRAQRSKLRPCGPIGIMDVPYWDSSCGRMLRSMWPPLLSPN